MKKLLTFLSTAGIILFDLVQLGVRKGNDLIKGPVSGYKLIQNPYSKQYFKKNGEVYFIQDGNFQLNKPIKLQTTDSDFQVLGKNYSVDSTSAYFKGQKIGGSFDMKTFKVIHDYFSVDKKNVIFQKIISKGVDPKSFKVINALQCKDKNHTYIIKGNTLEIFDK